jgi:hypothetical protein
VCWHAVCWCSMCLTRLSACTCCCNSEQLGLRFVCQRPQDGPMTVIGQRLFPYAAAAAAASAGLARLSPGLVC